MIRWGISAYNHNAALSVVDGDEILFASESERYSGIKNDANLPDELIQAALKFGEPEDINWYENNKLKNLRRLYAGQKLKRLPLHPYLKKRKINFHTHHTTHAAAGFYTSPYQNATVLVIDAIGEFTTTSIWDGVPHHGLHKIWSQRYPTSLGLFYSAITHRCYLKPNEEEYILMGLFLLPVKISGEYEIILPPLWHFPHTTTQCFKPQYEQIEWRNNEEEFEKWCTGTTGYYTQSNNLVFMGGCALNCVANGKIYER